MNKFVCRVVIFCILVIWKHMFLHDCLTKQLKKNTKQKKTCKRNCFNYRKQPLFINQLVAASIQTTKLNQFETNQKKRRKKLWGATNTTFSNRNPNITNSLKTKCKSLDKISKEV